MKIVRFAPSPTGHLHVGGARTALFNYLFSKKNNGKFILRIEDTDRDRSSEEMSEEILEGLGWLGIKWDPPAFHQSDNVDAHLKLGYKLLDEGKAYRCFCTPEEIQKRRVKDGETIIFKYDRFCHNLSEEDIERKLKEKVPYVIRFFVPSGETEFNDKMHKLLNINNTEIDDFVLIRSDKSPTYHLSVVADDISMGITDVIRGDDHISNTFKQILLFRVLKKPIPKYTHLPLIFGADKKKLSKRHGETSVLEFRKDGYLPEALITYFSQLSWNPGDYKKIFRMEDLVKDFKFEKMSKNSPIFDFDKLLFLNSRAIRERKPEEILDLLYKDEGFREKYSIFDKGKLFDLIELVKPRMKKLNDFKKQFDLFLSEELNYDPEEFKKTKKIEGIHFYIEKFVEKAENLNDFKERSIEEFLRDFSEKNSIKAADLIHPFRFALTNSNVSPSIFEVFEFFGKEKSLKRIRSFLKFLG
ncbi:MAG: glutamate--tRNA ligase [Acidobacteriota bacterium]